MDDLRAKGEYRREGERQSPADQEHVGQGGRDDHWWRYGLEKANEKHELRRCEGERQSPVDQDNVGQGGRDDHWWRHGLHVLESNSQCSEVDVELLGEGAGSTRRKEMVVASFVQGLAWASGPGSWTTWRSMS